MRVILGAEGSSIPELIEEEMHKRTLKDQQ